MDKPAHNKLDTILSVNIYEIIGLIVIFGSIILWVGAQGNAIANLEKFKDKREDSIVIENESFNNFRIEVEGRLSGIEAKQDIILEEVRRK